MKHIALFVGLFACSPPPQPPQTASNACVAPEPSCKSAVEKAATVAKVRDREITMAIGECDQHQWSMQARQCVADAHASADLVACGAKFDLGHRGMFADSASSGRAFKQMTIYKDQMCACKDSACAQRISDDMTKWAQEEARNNAEPPPMTEEDTKQFTELGEQMGTCMQKAMSTP
jgi:hypothetical protein